MIYPTYVVDNFFDNPQEVLNFSKELEFRRSDDGRWPGLRTGLIHETNQAFFDTVTRKISKVIWPQYTPNLKWRATMTFQKIPANSNTGQGWIHDDKPAEFTAIIYLSRHKGCGTSIYKRKENVWTDSLINKQYNDIKCEYYKNGKEPDQNYFDALNRNNKSYEKITQVNSLFNRLVIFDSGAIHGADQFYDPECQEDRLTLITFFESISGDYQGIKFPIPEMRKL